MLYWLVKLMYLSVQVGVSSITVATEVEREVDTGCAEESELPARRWLLSGVGWEPHELSIYISYSPACPSQAFYREQLTGRWWIIRRGTLPLSGVFPCCPWCWLSPDCLSTGMTLKLFCYDNSITNCLYMETSITGESPNSMHTDPRQELNPHAGSARGQC